MMLRIDIKNSNGGAVLRCTGRLVYGVEVETLRGIAKARPEKIIRIDLAGVERIDASGLGTMVELQSWAKSNRRQLVFENATERVRRLLEITKLDSVLPLEGLDESAIPLQTRCERQAMIA